MDDTTWWEGEGVLGKTSARQTANMPYTPRPANSQTVYVLIMFAMLSSEKGLYYQSYYIYIYICLCDDEAVVGSLKCI